MYKTCIDNIKYNSKKLIAFTRLKKKKLKKTICVQYTSIYKKNINIT
jgi:hypothetical protein